MKFECIPGCGLCDHFKVALFPEDIERVRGATGSDDFWIRGQDSSGETVGYMRRNGATCQFFTDRKRCSIYAQRPYYCRTYPFYEECFLDSQIDVDLSCPGIRYDSDLSDAQPEALFRSEVSERRPRIATAEIQQAARRLELLLTHRPGFIPLQWMEIVATRFLDAWLERIQATGNWIPERRLGLEKRFRDCLAQVDGQTAAVQLGEELADGEYLVDCTGKDTVFLQNEFPERLRNTRFSEGDAVLLYSVQVNRSDVVISYGQQTDMIMLSELDRMTLQPELFSQLLHYLRFWVRRQLLVRYAYSKAVIDYEYRNYPVFYLQFLLELLFAVQFMANVIAQQQRRMTPGMEDLREAIRLCDGWYRKKCQFSFHIKEV